MKFTISPTLTLQMLQTINLVKIGPELLKKKILKEDARRTPTHNNMSPELERLRWPSEVKVIGYLL